MGFPAIVQDNRHIQEYPEASGATFVEGAVLVANASGEVDEAGVDPSTILGFALQDAGSGPVVGFVRVGVAAAESTFWIPGTVAPLQTHVGDAYGLVADTDGAWILDISETVNTRAVVEDVDVDRGLFLVRILAANRQVAG